MGEYKVLYHQEFLGPWVGGEGLLPYHPGRRQVRLEHDGCHSHHEWSRDPAGLKAELLRRSVVARLFYCELWRVLGLLVLVVAVWPPLAARSRHRHTLF